MVVLRTLLGWLLGALGALLGALGAFLDALGHIISLLAAFFDMLQGLLQKQPAGLHFLLSFPQ